MGTFSLKPSGPGATCYSWAFPSGMTSGVEPTLRLRLRGLPTICSPPLRHVRVGLAVYPPRTGHRPRRMSRRGSRARGGTLLGPPEALLQMSGCERVSVLALQPGANRDLGGRGPGLRRPPVAGPGGPPCGWLAPRPRFWARTPSGPPR